LNGWLSSLVHELSEGREPILALAEARNIARTAVLDERGQFLSSDLGSDILERAVSNLAIQLESGQSSALVVNGISTVSERITKESFNFWKEAIKGRDESWASWLLTKTSQEGSRIKVTRHILSALGPFTPPRLPPGCDFSMLPLNSGLGKLIVFGDDDLALETAALAARAGIKATLVSANSLELDLRSAQQVGFFELIPLSDWSDLKARSLAEMGFKPGVAVLVTTPNNEFLLGAIKEFKVGWLGLAGDAAIGDSEPGLFPLAVTPALKALGLVAAILER
jgi:hypothetical protein